MDAFYIHERCERDTVRRRRWKKRKELDCYYCGERGHFARNCPEIRCWECGKKGHEKKSCFIKFFRMFANWNKRMNDYSVRWKEYIQKMMINDQIKKEKILSEGNKKEEIKKEINEKAKEEINPIENLELEKKKKEDIINEGKDKNDDKKDKNDKSKNNKDNKMIIEKSEFELKKFKFKNSEYFNDKNNLNINQNIININNKNNEIKVEIKNKNNKKNEDESRINKENNKIIRNRIKMIKRSKKKLGNNVNIKFNYKKNNILNINNLFDVYNDDCVHVLNINYRQLWEYFNLSEFYAEGFFNVKNIDTKANAGEYKKFILEIQNKLEELSKSGDISYELHLIDFNTNLYISRFYKSENEEDILDKWLCYIPRTIDKFNNGWSMMNIKEEMNLDFDTLIYEITADE